MTASFWVVSFACGLDQGMMSFLACNEYVRLLIVLPPPILHFEQKHLTLSFSTLTDIVLDMNNNVNACVCKSVFILLEKTGLQNEFTRIGCYILHLNNDNFVLLQELLFVWHMRSNITMML